jgi:uncharacterized protein YjiS (DUF1127 family)
MPSISHRASLDQGNPHRARSGPAALPAGFAGGLVGTIRAIAGWPVRWCADRLEDWRELRQLRELDDHLLRDIGLTVADARRSIIFHHHRERDAQDPKGPPTWPTTS